MGTMRTIGTLNKEKHQVLQTNKEEGSYKVLLDGQTANLFILRWLSKLSIVHQVKMLEKDSIVSPNLYEGYINEYTLKNHQWNTTHVYL